jgi:hypothetical protein
LLSYTADNDINTKIIVEKWSEACAFCLSHENTL